MRKLLLGLFVVLTMSMNAQIMQGSKIIGGTLGFGTTGGSTDAILAGTTTSNDIASTFNFQLVPQVGYMLTDNIGVGLGIGFNYQKTTTPNDLGSGTNVFDQVETTGGFVIAPVARYYKPLSEKFYIYGQFGIPIIVTSNSSLKLNDNGDGTVDNDEIDKSSTFGLNLSLGANYFITKNIALEAGINLFGIDFNRTKTTKTDKEGKNGIISSDSKFTFNFDTNNVFNTGAIAVGIKIFI